MLISQLHEIVVDSLSKDLYSNATFFAERLLSEADNEEVRYLLAKAYIGDGKFHKAFHVLKDTKSNHCRYQFAQVCLKLNRLVEGERALLTVKHFSKNILSKDLENVVPNGSAGYFLLGLITEKLGNRPMDCLNAYKKALELDPFMWCAYEKLCKMCPGKLDISKHFGELNPKVINFKKNFQSGGHTLGFNSGLTGNNQNDSYLTITPHNVNSNQPPKDFLLSPDNNMSHFNNKLNSVENKFTSNKVNRFNLINTNSGGHNVIEETDSQNSQNSQNQRFKTFQDIPQITINQGNNQNSGHVNTFNSNFSSNTNFIINPNMTPVVNKDKPDDYGNLNYNQPLMKNRDNLKPFTYSSSPHNVGALEFQKSSEQNTNILNSSNDIKNKYGDSVIKPFNISQSGLGVNEFTPHNIRNLKQVGSGRTEDNVPQQNNLFNNINLNEERGNIQNNAFNYTLTNSNISNVSRIKEIPNREGTNNQKFQDIFALMKHFAEIIKNLCLYNCEEAIKLIKTLPLNHQKSGWALTTLGRCYFEMAKYKESDKVFRESLKTEPARLEGLEYYSSSLWQLKDQFQLVNLANHVLEQSHFAAETWIVVGNCYSLQKEHEIAIKFFNRAIQINPNFAYAYTLSGHEYVSNESFNQAKQCFSNAISCDDRHFNAWWGLGVIHVKEQNYSEACKFFRKALSINEKSAILNFYLAQAYQQNKEHSKALVYFSTAERLDPSNPMIKYQKANILYSTKKADDALAILQDLNEKMPKEAAIHILMGKIYKLKKDYTKALFHFNAAIDIDPKDSNQAKSMIEKLYTEPDYEMI